MTTNNLPGKKIFFGWYLPFAGCLLALCYVIFTLIGFSVYLPHILAETGWSRAEASGVFGILGAEVGLLAPLYGFIVNRFGARGPTVIGSILGALGLMLASQAHSLLFFYFSFGLAGLGFAVYYFGPMASIANWFDKKRTFAMSIVLTGASLAGLLVPALSSAVNDYGWRQTVLAGGVITLLLCVPLSLLFRFRPEPYGYTVDGLPASTEQAATNEQAPQEAPRVSIRGLLRLPAFWLLMLLFVVANLGFSGILPHLLLFFQDVGLPEKIAALSFTFYGVTSLLGRLSGGVLGDRFDKRRVAATAFALLGVGFVGMSFTSEPWHLVFFVLLMAPGFGMASPVIPSLVADTFGAKPFPIIYSLAIVPGTVITLFAPATVGWSADTFGSYQFAFYSAGGLALLGVLMALKLPAPAEQPLPIPIEQR